MDLVYKAEKLVCDLAIHYSHPLVFLPLLVEARNVLDQLENNYRTDRRTLTFHFSPDLLAEIWKFLSGKEMSVTEIVCKTWANSWKNPRVYDRIRPEIMEGRIVSSFTPLSYNMAYNSKEQEILIHDNQAIFAYDLKGKQKSKQHNSFCPTYSSEAGSSLTYHEPTDALYINYTDVPLVECFSFLDEKQVKQWNARKCGSLIAGASNILIYDNYDRLHVYTLDGRFLTSTETFSNAVSLATRRLGSDWDPVADIVSIATYQNDLHILRENQSEIQSVTCLSPLCLSDKVSRVPPSQWKINSSKKCKQIAVSKNYIYLAFSESVGVYNKSGKFLFSIDLPSEIRQEEERSPFTFRDAFGLKPSHKLLASQNEDYLLVLNRLFSQLHVIKLK